MKTPPKSISGVCNTGIVSGPEADPAAAPDLLIEVPHGATRPLQTNPRKREAVRSHSRELAKS